MYVGRIVAVGMSESGHLAAMYRVSSRSFPNRETRLSDNKVAVMPRPGAEGDLAKNPYIAYNCLRLTGTRAVVSNGAQTDPITEKLAMGLPPRDALALSLLAMDYEKDQLDTPRIAGIVDRGSYTAFLGVVRRDALIVREFALKRGVCYYVATYEHNTPCETYVDTEFKATTAEEARVYITCKGVFANLEKPITAAAAVASEVSDFAIAAEK